MEANGGRVVLPPAHGEEALSGTADAE